MIELEHTTRCHLRCGICERTHFPGEYAHQDLPYDRFTRLLDQFPELRYINLTGEGSSFLNRAFPKMLSECQRRGIYVTAIDSFSALRPWQIAALVAHGVAKVPISCDASTKEVYESVRVGAKWERTLANIHALARVRESVESPLPEVIFRFIFYRDNWRDIPEYPALVETLLPANRDGDDGLMEFAALLEFEQTRGWEVELSQEIVEETEAEAKKRGLPIVWSHPSHDAAKKRPMRECCAWAEPYVMMGGYVLPCCSVVMSNRREFLIENCFGNVFEQDFRDIWDSERYRAFRRMVGKGEQVPILCEGCRAFNTIRRENLYGISEAI